MENDGMRPHTTWGQWDPDTWPETVVWRGEYSEQYQAEVQRTAMGVGALAVFDREAGNTVVVVFPVSLPETARQVDSDQWDGMVRKRLYAPPPLPFAIRNVYRRGWRRK